MKTTHLLLTIAAIAAITASSACKEDDNGSTSTSTTTGTGGGGGGGDTPVVDSPDSTFTIACDGPNDNPTTGTASTSMIERCIYAAADKSLALNFENGDKDGAITIDILDFKGVGTYKTGKDETGSTVYMSTGATHGGSWGSNPAGTMSPHECTLTVEKTNLLEAAKPGFGYIVVSLDCPVLGGAAIGELTCQVSPSHFAFSVAKCEASP